MARSRGWRQGVRADDDGGSGSKHSGNFGELIGHIVRGYGQGVAQRTGTGGATGSPNPLQRLYCFRWLMLENVTDAVETQDGTSRSGGKTSWLAAANQRPLADAWRSGLDVAQDRGGSGWQSCVSVLAHSP